MINVKFFSYWEYDPVGRKVPDMLKDMLTIGLRKGVCYSAA